MENKCPFYKECGGCDYQNIDYQQEIKIKEDYINQLLKKTGYKKHIEVVPMEDPFNYRNKVIIAFKIGKNKKVTSGIYEEASHRIISVRDCNIQNKELNQCVKDIEEALNNNKILPFGYGGVLKHAVLRIGHRTNEILVTLVTSTPMFPGRANLVNALVKKNKNIKAIVQNIQDRDTPIVLGEEQRILYGTGFVYDYLKDLKFKISSKSFYQINSIQTEKLYQEAITQAGLSKNDVVIDAYSGIGTIGLFVSDYCQSVICVENNKEAVLNAKENIKINKKNNVNLICEDATKFLEKMAESRGKIDVLFLDPPRSGTTTGFIKSIEKMKIKKVVYISCGPESLVRDLLIFQQFGYSITNIKSFDMFPKTRHVETVCVLTNRAGNKN